MDIPLIEQIRIRAQVLVPLLKAFQSEIGPDRTNEIARKALRSYTHKLAQERRSQLKGNSMEKIAAWFSMCSAGDALDLEVLKQTPDAFEVNVTGCRYAQFYKELGEPELGFLFLCSLDHPMTEGLTPDVQLTRTQTIMQGANHCDFRFQVKKEESQE